MTTATTFRRMTLNELVGIPYRERGRSMQGADCWGVCLIAGRHLFDIDLPEYFYTEADILRHACEHIGHETHDSPHWVPKFEGPHARGSIHIFRIKGYETHCGIHVGGGQFLHSLPGRNSCIESLTDPAWVLRRTGTYTWTP